MLLNDNPGLPFWKAALPLAVIVGLELVPHWVEALRPYRRELSIVEIALFCFGWVLMRRNTIVKVLAVVCLLALIILPLFVVSSLHPDLGLGLLGLLVLVSLSIIVHDIFVRPRLQHSGSNSTG